MDNAQERQTERIAILGYKYQMLMGRVRQRGKAQL